MDGTPLEAEIRRRIANAGPMPVWQYMALCLTDPRHGYYITRDPLGRSGDFITAPEISQMFGELIGLWAAAVWQSMGAPENVRLVELGPGRGSMMADALRAIRVIPDFRKAVVAHLVEISPALQERQQQTLRDIDVPTMWHKSFDDVPPGPLIVIGNEFFDALPVHQAVKQINGWYERVVEINSSGDLAFSVGADRIPGFDVMIPAAVRDAPMGTIFEWRADAPAFELARRVLKEGGAGLLIDYGHAASDAGETLQAIARHGRADPLDSPGEIDLTAHVDFQALERAFDGMGARVYGPVPQAQFLRRLGLDKRSETLKVASGSIEKAREIDAAVARLTAGGSGMGALFKAIAFGGPKLGALPGFEA